MTVERVELAPDLSISRVLTGLWQIADMERHGRAVDLDAAAAAMEPYVDAGLTTFDMADHYGSAEEIVGRFITRHGEGVVEVATKWVPKPGRIERHDVRAAVERSLERLRSSAIDLLQFHAWRYSDPSYLDCLFWLQELRDEGLVRHVGVTNFDAVHLDLLLATGLEVVSNQVSFSLLDRRAASGLAAVCRRHGVALLAYGTLGGGLLSERWLGASEPKAHALDTWSRMKYKRFIDAGGGWGSYQELLAALRSVARRLGVSVAQVAARSILDEAAVAGVIIGARLGESEHIGETVALAGLEIDAAGRQEIEQAVARRPVVPGDCGDEYRRPPFLTASGDLRHHFEELPPPYPVEVREGRRLAASGTAWEELAGYSRAVRCGDRVSVSGTTATHGLRLIGGTDPAAQTHFVIDKIEGALLSLGARLEDVVRTRVFVSDRSHWEPVARAHGQRFAEVRPANTLVEARLVGREYLVEMEAEAVAPRPAEEEGDEP
jgi:aryl-alcohol dehydrogenase-like predicted oxidoreductase/enamine deaminase RidA (YjgF/YER057c/UK114 family)